MFRFSRDSNASIICTVFSIQKQLLCILANRIGMNNKTNCVTSSERKSTSMFMFMFIETKSTLSASATEKRSVLFSYFIYTYRFIYTFVSQFWFRTNFYMSMEYSRSSILTYIFPCSFKCFPCYFLVFCRFFFESCSVRFVHSELGSLDTF